MNKALISKLYDGQYVQRTKDTQPIPIIRIIKKNANYIVFNIRNPKIRVEFNTVKELLEELGFPGERPHAFDDQTGEDIFRGL